MMNFGPLTAEIGSGVWGTPTNFNGFCVSQTLRRGTEGATYIRQGGHQAGRWPTFLVLSFFFIPRLISAVADWMSTILLHMVWP